MIQTQIKVLTRTTSDLVQEGHRRDEGVKTPHTPQVKSIQMERQAVTSVESVSKKKAVEAAKSTTMKAHPEDQHAPTL